MGSFHWRLVRSWSGFLGLFLGNSCFFGKLGGSSLLTIRLDIVLLLGLACHEIFRFDL